MIAILQVEDLIQVEGMTEKRFSSFMKVSLVLAVIVSGYLLPLCFLVGCFRFLEAPLKPSKIKASADFEVAGVDKPAKT